jgi:alanine-glyoxylate transaminase/serine-glyoxylate transaminase/serine-pyruvate transaminase
VPAGRHFLQIPGPTNLPEAVLAALARPLVDHRSDEFAAVALEALDGLRWVAGAAGPVVVWSGSGTAGWEAALVNTLSPGDRVLLCENGYFAARWGDLAERLGLAVERLAGDWRVGPDPDELAAALARDPGLKAVLVVHNETSTGVTARIPALRAAIDGAGHDALLLVDTISSLGSLDYRHDEWRVDVTVGCSQKGLMLPPGLAINVVGERALAAAASARLPRSYLDWEPMLPANETGRFPFTPASGLFPALVAALGLLREEGLDRVLARHDRHAEATRRAVEAWGLEVLAQRADERSSVLTAVVTPEAERVRELALRDYDLALGAGLGQIAGETFRIGHLGDLNDLMLCGTLCGVELALQGAGVPLERSGIADALAVLAGVKVGPAISR